MRRLSSFVFAALLVGGCAQQPTLPEGATASPLQLPGSSLEASGFLGKDYSRFTPVPGKLDTWRWVKSGVNWRQYNKVLIQPVEVWINRQAEYGGIQPDMYKRMADEFRAVVTQQFRAGGYEIVDKPGPGVLRLHFALTGVNPERPGFTPLDVLPIKIAINVARSATGTDKTVIALSGEVEVLDSVTGERLFASVSTRKDVHLFVGRQLTWDDVRTGATEWAVEARERLDAARVATR
jgi:hypothetical protein